MLIFINILITLFILSCTDKQVTVKNEVLFENENFDIEYNGSGFKHKDYVFYIDVFKNYVVSGSADNSITIWDYEKSNLITNIFFNYRGKWGIPVKFSKNGRYIVVGALEELLVLNTDNYKLVSKKLAHIKGVQSISISPDNKYVFSGGADGFVRVWSLPDLNLVYEKKILKGEVWNTHIDSSGTLAIAGGSTKEVVIFSFPELTIKKIITNDYPVEFVNFSDDNNYFLFADNFGYVVVYKMLDPDNPYVKFREHISEVLVAKFIDTNFLISGGRDGDIYIYDLKNKNVLKKYNIGSAVFYFEKSNKYKLLVVGTQKGNVLFYKIISKE
ncbi:MAG: hypothetical protein N2258_08425 [Brevinematales bacterium]|nr:hypothetical protein [Brevinematales bacterium]